MDVLFGALTVALEQPVWLIEYVRTAVATLLSGSLLPLAYSSSVLASASFLSAPSSP